MSKKTNPNTIALNKKALHDYHIEEHFEAGLVLEGWEVKSLRAGNCQLKESYLVLKDSEAFIIGAHISPLLTASTHIKPDPVRTRKLLLNRKELNKLIGSVQRKGYTAIPLSFYWKKGKAKADIALAIGKKTHDKRASDKARDWKRDQGRLLKSQNPPK